MRNSISNLIQVSAAILCSMIFSSRALATDEVMERIRNRLHEKMTAAETLSLRSQIVQARYDEDRKFLHGEKQQTTSEEILRELRAGDILLIRTPSLTGSIAARTSDVPGQFSHLILIAQDPTSKRLKTIESDFGTGVTISPLDLKSRPSWARVALLRYKDAALAKRASERLLEKLEEASKSGPIHYDNRLDLADPTQLYCTEVATYAFHLVGEQVPQRLSRIQFLDDKTRRRLKIATPEVFTPQDLEIDPRFELVKEWRKPESLQKIYVADAVFGSYFRWVREGKARIGPGPFEHLIALFGRVFARNKIAKEIGEDPRDQQTISNLIKYGLHMYSSINDYSKQLNYALKRRDTRYFTVSDYEKVLEDIRYENEMKMLSPYASDAR